MNKPKLNQPDMMDVVCEKYPRKNYKLNQPLDYLQELKRDVSIKGNLTFFQKMCFEHIEKALNKSDPTLEEAKKEWEDDGWEWKEGYSHYQGREYERYCIFKKFGSDEKTIVLEEYNKKIYLFYGYETFNNEGYKVFENKSFKMSFKELQRITKTVRALKWEV